MLSQITEFSPLASQTVLRHLGILAMIYLGVVAQCSVVPTETHGLGHPFLPAMMLVLIAATCHPTAAILWAGTLGFVLDGLSTERLGIQLGLAALLALGMQMTHALWRSRRVVPLVAMTMLVCVAWRTLSPMVQAVLAGRVVDPHFIVTNAVQDAAWTALVAGLLLLGRRLIGLSDSEVDVATPAGRWSPVVR